MKRISFLVACMTFSSLSALSASVNAKDNPYLVGTWVGQAPFVTQTKGSQPSGPETGTSLSQFSTTQTTVVIQKQRDNRFYGYRFSEAASQPDPLVGAIHHDRKTGIMQDSGGRADFTLRKSGNDMDVCFGQSTAVIRTASCYTLTRQP